jgi:hypothetical protein
MRAMLFLSVFVGMLWTVDTFSLQGRVTQASKDMAPLSLQADRIRNLEIEILLQPLERKPTACFGALPLDERSIEGLPDGGAHGQFRVELAAGSALTAATVGNRAI